MFYVCASLNQTIFSWAKFIANYHANNKIMLWQVLRHLHQDSVKINILIVIVIYTIYGLPVAPIITVLAMRDSIEIVSRLTGNSKELIV